LLQNVYFTSQETAFSPTHLKIDGPPHSKLISHSRLHVRYSKKLVTVVSQNAMRALSPFIIEY